MNLNDLPGMDNEALKEIIAARIRAAGSIAFDEFMRLALYHPVHGYYCRCEPALDYQSSPNVHPVFGAVLARQIAGFWRLLGRPARFEVFEAGAGNGGLAAAILQALRLAEPELYAAVHYTLQDVNLAAADAELIERAGLPKSTAVIAEALPETPRIEGCILSNELLDALPFRRLRKRDGRLFELNVALADGRFVDLEVAPSPAVRAYFDALGLEPGEGCEAEVSLEAVEWTRRAAMALRRGYVLSLDYGYEASDLFAPWRKQGTLLTFYRHTAGDDPYARIGRQDITASVDFTSVRRAGEGAGLKTYGLATQTGFLTALGIGEALSRRPAAGEMEAYYALRRSVSELMEPSGLGRIRVLIQGKGTPDALPRGLTAFVMEKKLPVSEPLR